MHRAAQPVIAIIFVCVLSACSQLPAVENEISSPMPTASAVSNVATQQPSQPSATANGLVVGQRYRIGQRATSDDSVLGRVALELRSAEVTANALVLHVAFVNTSDQGFRIIGSLGGADARLSDANGKEYAPTKVDSALRTIDPPDGFAPGVANVGDLQFSLPNTNGPYELRFPRFAPIRFQLDTPETATEAAVSNGMYPLDGVVRSQNDALRQIELRFQSLEVQPESVVFTVAFVNTGRQGYNLIVGPSGKDARLIDGEGRQYMPSSVSDAFASSIAPKDGWQPQQAYSGTITFPRPADATQLRFVFPQYDALTIRFDAEGQVATTVTSPSGGAPAPTPIPKPEEVALGEIEALLKQQTDAMRNNDVGMFTATLAPPIQAERRQIIERAAQLPVLTYTLRLAPEARITSDASQTNVPVELTYTLRGISPDNVFKHELRYDFARNGNAWQATRIDAVDNPPFWWLGDVILRETPHFLIFARPELRGDLDALERETEQAYATLQGKGFPLESRYVAYFPASQEDFTRLTGRTARFLGVALSRYEFRGNSITTTSRAFYINGATFREKGDQFSANERQTTITHELVHLALAAETRPFMPPWLIEGTAVYFSGDSGVSMRRGLVEGSTLENMSLETLTRAGSLGEHDAAGERTNDEYAFSGEAVTYLIEKYGEPRLLEFYRSYAAVPAQDVIDKLPQFGSSGVTDAAFADLSAKLTEDAVQQFFGVTLAQLDTNVKAWIRANV